MAKEKKFRELSDEDLKQVTGGAGIDCTKYPNLTECRGWNWTQYEMTKKGSCR